MLATSPYTFIIHVKINNPFVHVDEFLTQQTFLKIYLLGGGGGRHKTKGIDNFFRSGQRVFFQTEGQLFISESSTPTNLPKQPPEWALIDRFSHMEL